MQPLPSVPGASVSALPRSFRPSYRKGTESSVLDTIGAPEVNCAVWLRSLPAGVEGAVTTWANRSTAPFDEVVKDPNGLFEHLGRIDDERVREWLRRDVAGLVLEFIRISVSSRVRVFFGAIHGDQCRKFHSDVLRLRLISTYAGPGTEWLPDHAVRRELMRVAPECPMEANARIVRDQSLVERARAGDVLLLKGERYPTAHPVVHRSPPIEATRETRVVLVASTYDPAP